MYVWICTYVYLSSVQLLNKLKLMSTILTSASDNDDYVMMMTKHKSNKRVWRRSVYIYMYIITYMLVCVCVCATILATNASKELLIQAYISNDVWCRCWLVFIIFLRRRAVLSLFPSSTFSSPSAQGYIVIVVLICQLTRQFESISASKRPRCTHAHICKLIYAKKWAKHFARRK